MQRWAAMRRLSLLALGALAFVRCGVGDLDVGDDSLSSELGALHGSNCPSGVASLNPALDACFDHDGGQGNVLPCVEAACHVDPNASRDDINHAVHDCIEHACPIILQIIPLPHPHH
jgi:hypothetical protein